MMRWGLALVVVSIIVQSCSAQQAFLQDQLPLKVLVTTPSDLGSEAAAASGLTLTGRQALTVVFSRPVIALGSDWGSEKLPPDLVPFSLSCGTPGRLRWVTTNIARFDPSIDWPTDLDCAFNWNKALKAYDGATLQLGALRPSVRLQTQPLSMSVQQVQSEATMAATGGQWSAFLGSPDDLLPEVPPDANITVSFSYPVELAQLAKSLRVAGPGAGSRTVTVSPCPSRIFSPLPVPLVFTANGIQSGLARGSPADLLKANSTCAVVKIVPGLAPGAAAVLRLPKGARYSPVAGPVTNDTEVNVYGLRPFRIPLRWDFMNISSLNESLYNAVMYRRLTLWLPHGLSKDTKYNDVKNAIQLCCLTNPLGSIDSSSNCVNRGFELNKPYPAVLSIKVPTLNPKQRCVVRIKADAKVKDAFGLPLQSSSNVWWTQELDPAFVGPSVRQVALLEPLPGNPTLNWPWVSRGVPEEGVRQVQAVSIPLPSSSNSSSSSSNTGGSQLLERSISGVLAGYGGAAASLLNTAGVKVARKDATWPTFQSLALPGRPGISLVGSCCRQVSWPSSRDVLSTNVLVVQSDLQAAFIEQQGQLLAWVTTTQGQSKPVANAKVQIYSSVYGVEAAMLGPSCVTSSDGGCTIDLKAAKQQQAAKNGANSGFQPSMDSATQTALITADGHGPLLVPDLPNSGRYRSSSSSDNKQYMATLVLDRKLVKPGDELHVTAFIQRKEGTQLKVAQDLPSVVFHVTPGFDRSASSSRGSSRGSSSSNKAAPTRITASVDPKYGTAHAIISIPKNATPANYNLQLWTGVPPGAGAESAPGTGEVAPGIAAAVNMPVSMPVAVSSAAKPAAAAAVSVAAAVPPAKAAGSNSTKPAAGAAKPTIAVNPKPKQLIGSVPSFRPSHPPGKPVAVPQNKPEPHFGSTLASGSGAVSSSSAQGRRRLQQQAYPEAASDTPDEAAEPDDSGAVLQDEAEPEDSVVPEPAAVEVQPVPSSLPVSTGASTTSRAPAPGSGRQATPGSSSVPSANVNSASTGSASIAYTTFTVGDPRPPTASLALSTASNWVRPDGAVSVRVATKSYVGSDVSGAEVKVKWSSASADGELVLKTNASGVATGVIELSKLPAANRSEPGATLSIRATWIGPTREPLTQSKTVKIADGPVRVELQRTLLTDVPGIAFGVRAEAFSNEDDTPVKGATVNVAITPRNGTASVRNCTAAQRSLLAQQACSIKSGDPAAAASCQLLLPCAGDFVLKGCISGNSNGTGCSKPVRVGRNITSWAASPWSSGPGQINLLPDKKNISMGGDVALTLQNPFWGPVSALVVWGNGVQRERFFLEQIPPGASTVMIQELGPECRGGCNVVVTLAVARPQGVPAGNTASPTGDARNAAGRPNWVVDGTGAADTSSSDSDTAPAATPRGLADSGPAAQSTSAAPDQPRASAPLVGGGYMPVAPNGAPVVRTFNRLWPFRVRVNMPPGTAQMIRSSVFGNPSGNSAKRRSNTINNRLRLTRTRNERGSAAAAAAAALPTIPRSKLYDPYAPVTVSAEVELQMADADSLQVDVAVRGQAKDAGGVAVLAPQSRQGSISVSVRDASGAPVPSAEVTIVVVDKAVLDLMPYALQDVSGAMQPKVRAGFSLLHLNSLRVTRAAINATFSTLQRRLLQVDPWLPLDTQVTAADGLGPVDIDAGGSWLPTAAAVDVPDNVYFKSYTTALTAMPSRPCAVDEVNCVRAVASHSHNHGVMPMMGAVAADALEAPAPAPAPMAAGVMPRAANAMAKTTAEDSSAGGAPGSARSAGPSAAAAGAQLRLQQAFKVTPVFKVVQTGADGKAILDFAAPDNLGRFVVRAYVAAVRAAVRAANGSSGVVYGGQESELVVRRTVSLVPSLPRQVRVGDNFTAGVLVEAPGTDSDVTVTVAAAVQQPGSSSASNSQAAVRMAGDSSRTVTLTPSKPQQEVRFDFSSIGIGIQNVTFTATPADAKRGGNLLPWIPRGLQQLLQRRNNAANTATAAAGAVADQVQLQVPVNGKQGPVTVATSFAVRGTSSNGTGSWQEGMVLPRAESSSGSLDLIAGVGSLPAIQAVYTGLAEQGLESSGCTSASQAVALSVLPAFLSLYQQRGTPASAALTAQQASLAQSAAAAVSGKLTNARFGLLAVEPSCLFPNMRGPERADVALNAWAAWVTQQALPNRANAAAGGARNAGTLSAAWGSIQEAAQTWQKALELQLVADAVSARKGSQFTPPGPYSDLEAMSWARLVLGPSWTPTSAKPSPNGSAQQNSQDVGADVKKDLSMQRLTAAALAGNLTVGGQARVGLALLREPKAVVGSNAGKQLLAADAVQKLSRSLTSSIRVGGRTAYIATGDGMRAAAGLSDQSLALSFLVGANVDNPLIQKLAAWVAQGAAPPPLFFAAVSVSSNPWDAVLRAESLTNYDSSTASLTPDLKLTVNAQPKPSLTSKRAPVTLLTAGFTPQQADKLASSSTSWAAVPANSTLVFGAQGNGEVSVAAALSFTPADLLPFPTYRGLWVQRAVLWEQQTPSGSSSNSAGGSTGSGGVGLGQLVTVAVQVTSPDDQSDVVVEVLMPGGLEPLDPNVFKDPDAATLCKSGQDEAPLTGDSSSSSSFGGGFNGMASGFSKSRAIGMAVSMTMDAGDGSNGFVGGGYGGFWRPSWPVCPSQTTAPDRVTFRFGYMRAGTHTMRFQAVAATSGTFVLPPVKALVQQQPEVMGLSPAGSLTVCSKATGGCAPAVPAAPATAAAAKACPEDCNGNGACNLAQGLCICNSGFGGVSCGDLASY